MASDAPQILVPFGFFGAGNIGDESTLQGFARLIKREALQVRVCVASRDPIHTAAVEPAFAYFPALRRSARGWWARQRATGAAFVGGTPIMDILGSWPLREVVPLVSSAHARGRPVVFIGVGTETLHREESRALIRHELAPRVEYWTVRSERDAERLTAYGVPPDRLTVAADLAWLLEPSAATFGQTHLRAFHIDPTRRYVGVNVNAETFLVHQCPQFFEALASFLDALADRHDLDVLFLANEVRDGEEFDTAAAQKVIAAMKRANRARQVPNRYWAPEQMCSIIANCALTVSTRYHFCVFSALQAVPFIALKRSDKVDDLCGDLAWPYAASLEQLSTDHLLTIAEDLERAGSAALEHLGVRVQSLRERAQRNRTSLLRLFGSSGRRLAPSAASRSAP